MGRCVDSVSTFFIVSINLIFFLGSALMLGMGVTAKVNPDEVSKAVSYVLLAAIRDELRVVGVDMSNIVVSNGTFMIVIGTIGVLISGIGFFGACCRTRCLLTLYATLMIILLLGQGALIAFAIVYPDSFKSVIQQNMIRSLQLSFVDEIKLNADNSITMPTGVVEIAWSSIQIKEKCCGALNWTDYLTFQWNNAGLVPSSIYAGSAVVPISCCAQSNPDQKSTFPPTYNSFINLMSCLQGNPLYINKQNCYDAIENDVENFIRNYRGLAIGITSAVAGAELIIIVMAILLLRKPKKYVRFVNRE